MITRRDFFSRTLHGVGLGVLLPAVQSCASSKIEGEIIGANSRAGHLLRDGKFPAPFRELKTGIAIVGGGVSGLSAARYLKRHTTDFLLLELDTVTGGNAMGGSSSGHSFPWGAHYLPIPGNGDPELIDFLSQSGVITGIKNGLPVFNEYYLCHDPKERLYINNFWQEGLIPQVGVPSPDKEQINRFLELMHSFKEMKGGDGKFAFTFPVVECSTDRKFLDLDRMNALEFLHSNNLNSPYLHWYVNYCCADDYGSSLSETSAWAMIHYFASRRAKAANAESDAVLTWPQGNFWLTQKLRAGIENNILTESVVFNVSIASNATEILFYNIKRNETTKLIADKVIMATPQFVNQRILGSLERKIDYKQFQYGPWMTANIHTNHRLNERRGEPLCWDNVIYGSDGLGYINASHQETRILTDKTVITYYKPITGDPLDARRNAYKQTHSGWMDMILADLRRPHPDIEGNVSRIDVWVWGHGMVRPSPGFSTSTDRINAKEVLGKRILFAHSDLSGISVFEEAFYNGHTAARKALNNV